MEPCCYAATLAYSCPPVVQPTLCHPSAVVHQPSEMCACSCSPHCAHRRSSSAHRKRRYAVLLPHHLTTLRPAPLSRSLSSASPLFRPKPTMSSPARRASAAAASRTRAPLHALWALRLLWLTIADWVYTVHFGVMLSLYESAYCSTAHYCAVGGRQ
jgi:hypothetical protein